VDGVLVDRRCVKGVCTEAPTPPTPPTPRSRALFLPHSTLQTTGLSAPLFINAFTSGPSEPKIKHPPTIKEVLQAMAPQQQQQQQQQQQPAASE
jgi:hypothetical protein